MPILSTAQQSPALQEGKPHWPVPPVSPHHHLNSVTPVEGTVTEHGHCRAYSRRAGVQVWIRGPLSVRPGGWDRSIRRNREVVGLSGVRPARTVGNLVQPLPVGNGSSPSGQGKTESPGQSAVCPTDAKKLLYMRRHRANGRGQMTSGRDSARGTRPPRPGRQHVWDEAVQQRSRACESHPAGHSQALRLAGVAGRKRSCVVPGGDERHPEPTPRAPHRQADATMRLRAPRRAPAARRPRGLRSRHHPLPPQPDLGGPRGGVRGCSSQGMRAPEEGRKGDGRMGVPGGIRGAGSRSGAPGGRQVRAGTKRPGAAGRTWARSWGWSRPPPRWRTGSWAPAC